MHPVWLGGLLFAAYLPPDNGRVHCAHFVYLLWRKRREAGLTAVTAVGLLLLFAIYTRTTMGLWLPPYYFAAAPRRGSTPVPIVLYGLLFESGTRLVRFRPDVFAGIAAGGLEMAGAAPGAILWAGAGVD
ncbi:MAG: hypothetical protein IPH82_23560 [Chloroflexi bacterium]|nr:hypothetical protein [Chloroflexota bacterium]